MGGRGKKIISLEFFLFFTGALALLFLIRPYSGIRHDAVFYLGQGLLKWKFDAFEQDLFFAFGGQAKFSMFPCFLAWFLDRFPAADIFLFFTLIGRVFFFISSCVLVWQLFPRLASMRFLCVFSVLIMPSIYGGHFLISYGEPFFTGRTLAEPLGILALAAAFSGRWGLCVICWVAAALIHPLQALAVWLVIWVWLVLGSRYWLLLLLPCLFIAGLSILGVECLKFVVQKYDLDWYSWIVEPNKFVFLETWPVDSWLGVGMDYFILILGLRYFGGQLRRFALSILLALTMGLLASFVLADILKLVFMTGLQLWRVQWVAHWFAMATLPFLAWHIYRDQYGSERVYLFLAMVIWGACLGKPGASLWVAVFILPAFIFWGDIVESVRPRVRKMFLVIVGIALLFGLGMFAVLTLFSFYKQEASLATYRLDSVFLSYSLVGFVLLGGAILVWKKGGQGCRATLSIGVSVLFLYSAVSWDSRSTWSRYVETWRGVSNPFGVVMENNAQVYWEDELLAPWLVLHRASYFSDEQQAGLLFSRKTAEEAHRRNLISQQLAVQAELCKAIVMISGRTESCAPDESTVKDMCIASGGKLSYVVLQSKLTIPELGRWHVPREDHGDKAVTYYLYGCKGFEWHATQG